VQALLYSLLWISTILMTECRVQHPKPWEFGTSKFAGLLGKADPDEFFGD
jgi:hypothetical protein